MSIQGGVHLSQQNEPLHYDSLDQFVGILPEGWKRFSRRLIAEVYSYGHQVIINGADDNR
jgi:hypothetical protein